MFSRAELDAENSAHAEIISDITRLHNQPYVSSSLEASEELVLNPKRKESNSIGCPCGWYSWWLIHI
jgi:hypothetical protein